MILNNELIKSVLGHFEGASLTDIKKIKDEFLYSADSEDIDYLISSDEFGLDDDE